MIKSIIAKLKEGSIKNVVLFSNSTDFPSPPYVCVKPETGVIERTRNFRIIVHHKKAMINDLQDYTLKELDVLLGNTIDDEEGNRFELFPNGYTDITAEVESDGYFMERMYVTPLTIRN